ncbi:YicC family protein [soil metagenome]
MLLSMTGFGEARTDSIRVELRAVNNRHLKVTVRGSDPYPMLESEIEKVVKRDVKRGTLLVMIRVERAGAVAGRSLNIGVLKAYTRQIQEAFPNPLEQAALLPGLVSLPGVAPEDNPTEVPEDEWPAVEKVLIAAIVKLNEARATEGKDMAAELLALKAGIAAELAKIQAHLPSITANYRQRLLERVKLALGDGGVVIDPAHLVREIAVFADRIDVAEEMTRLNSHLAGFDEIIRTGGDAPGRKLEFVVQEMGREANTLGSKAGDVVISRHVVEIKASLEKIRELVQNIE